MKGKISIFIIIIILIITILSVIFYNKDSEKQSILIKFNGYLYKQSDYIIDYVGGDIPIGKICKLSEELIPQNDGETNTEYLVGKTIFGTKNILNDIKKYNEAIVVETTNSYILFEKIK